MLSDIMRSTACNNLFMQSWVGASKPQYHNHLAQIAVGSRSCETLKRGDSLPAWRGFRTMYPHCDIVLRGAFAEGNPPYSRPLTGQSFSTPPGASISGAGACASWLGTYALTAPFLRALVRYFFLAFRKEAMSLMSDSLPQSISLHSGCERDIEIHWSGELDS